MHRDASFTNKPTYISWELTKTCEHSCNYCKIHAKDADLTNELTLDENLDLLDQMAELGRVHLSLMGGNLLLHEDLVKIVNYARAKSIIVSINICNFSDLTKELLEGIYAAGADHFVFTLNGAIPEVHNRSFGYSDSFDLTVKTIHKLNELNIPFKIITSVTRHNFYMIEELAQLIAELNAKTWLVTTFVPSNRKQVKECITSAEHENLYKWLYKLRQTAPFTIKALASSHYRRVVLQESLANNLTSNNEISFQNLRINENYTEMEWPISFSNDGDGMIFIANNGDVFPSETLLIKAGNVRTEDLQSIYLNSKLFQELRDYKNLKGKCNKCEYRDICGGSRSRAYIVTGDYLASEPFCVYVPEQIRSEMKV